MRRPEREHCRVEKRSAGAAGFMVQESCLTSCSALYNRAFCWRRGGAWREFEATLGSFRFAARRLRGSENTRENYCRVGGFGANLCGNCLA